MQGMRHVVDVLSAVPGMDPNDSRICVGLELVGPRRSDEYLRSRNQSRQVDQVAQRCDLSYSLDGTFTEDGKETWITGKLEDITDLGVY